METTKKPRITKTHLICLAIAKFQRDGVQPTRVQVLQRVHVEMEHRKTPFKPTSNHCYFSPQGHGNGGYISVVHRGLVLQAWKRADGTIAYALTPAGEAMALEAARLVLAA